MHALRRQSISQSGLRPCGSIAPMHAIAIAIAVDERKQEAMHLVCRCVYYSRLYSLCYNRAHERERLQRRDVRMRGRIVGLVHGARTSMHGRRGVTVNTPPQAEHREAECTGWT